MHRSVGTVPAFDPVVRVGVPRAPRGASAVAVIQGRRVVVDDRP